MVVFTTRMHPEIIQPFWAALQAGRVHHRGRARREYLPQEGCTVDGRGERDQAASWPLSGGPVSLTFCEREEIALGRARGESVRCIARGLGRAPSTVSRELSRNTDRRGEYRATSAHALAWQRASRPKLAKLWVNQRLREIVEQLLERRYSPEQIAGRLGVKFPDERGTNENTNGLLRQYFPKGTDLGKVTALELTRSPTSSNRRLREASESSACCWERRSRDPDPVT